MKTAVATKLAGSINIDAATGLLIDQGCPYELSIEEIYAHFVVGAPFAEAREFLFRVFVNYLEQTSAIVPERRIWVDGSFVSLRQDRAPSDVDVLMIVESPTLSQKKALAGRGLLTMSDVSVTIAQTEMPTLPKLAPYGGLIDAYFVEANQAKALEAWEMQWSTPKDEHGDLDFERTKGFVEVITNDQD